jgi:hypothetical protein
MKSIRTSVSFLVALALLPSCASRFGDFSALSNRTLPPPAHLGARVSGSDCTWNILAIPLGEMSIEQAVDNAMASDPKALYLTDVTVRRTGWWLGETCYRVDGTVVLAEAPAPKPAAPQAPATPVAPPAPPAAPVAALDGK